MAAGYSPWPGRLPPGPWGRQRLCLSKAGWTRVATVIAICMTTTFTFVIYVHSTGGTFYNKRVFAAHGVLLMDLMAIFVMYYANCAVMIFMIWCNWHCKRKFLTQITVVCHLSARNITEEDVVRLVRCVYCSSSTIVPSSFHGGNMAMVVFRWAMSICMAAVGSTSSDDHRHGHCHPPRLEVAKKGRGEGGERGKLFLIFDV